MLIKDLPLAPRAKGALQRGGYTTLDSLAAAISAGTDLTQIDGVGAPTVETIKKLASGDDKPDAPLAKRPPYNPDPAPKPLLVDDPRVEGLARALLFAFVEHSGKTGGGLVADAWDRALEFFDPELQPKKLWREKNRAKVEAVLPRQVTGQSVKKFGNPILQAAFEQSQGFKDEGGFSDAELARMRVTE